MNIKTVEVADNDVRYVPYGGRDFQSIAHESRYQWVINGFDLEQKKVLDLGCGSGYGSYALSKYARDILGVDYSVTAIEYAKRQFKMQNLKFSRFDATSADFIDKLGDQNFDLIVSFDVIEHVEKYFIFLENTRRTIKPDGVTIIGCPNRLETFNWNKEWNEYHFQEFSPAQLRWLCELFYEKVSVFGQDFSCADLREKIRTARTASEIKRDPKILRSIKKRIGRTTKHTTAPMLTVGDIEFLEEAHYSIQQSFGLVAVCRHPRRM